MKGIERLAASLAAVLVLIVVSSCGGGSSSSGGGSKAATPFAGVYTGVEAISMSGPGGTFPLGQFPITIAVDPSGNVRVIDIDAIPFYGKLGDPALQLLPNEFVATQFVGIATPPGITCQPNTFGYRGSITGNTVTGSVSGSFLCFSPNGAATIVVGGPFSAIKDALAVVPPDVSPAATVPPVGGQRKSEKQRAIKDAFGMMY